MVTSPKTGRELDGTRIRKGPRWLSRLVRRHLGDRPSDDESDG